MKRKISTILMLAGCLGLSGCNEKVDKFPILKNFVCSYENPTSAYAEIRETFLNGDPIPEGQAVDQFVVLLRADKSTEISERTNEETFRELAARFNDTEYNSRGPCMTNAMYIRSESLDIISDQDYNAAHPAGSSLNDLFTLEYSCADDILKSGYDLQQYRWMFKEPVEEFNRKQPTLIAFSFTFWPTAMPEKTATHRFTITYKNVEGKVLVATTGPVTIAGASD